ncbi:hypothetical protein [Gracilibacillus xinjiangensis]|uniref:DUF7210 domain-containing protein n=1 Tax=Gracilibacillus xinjiangensis TaxID=1193282 RepID=A0ABV8WZ67_9BACI
MLELYERVTHNGRTYEAGQSIENIEKKQAERLVRLGAAFFVGNKQGNASPDEGETNNISERNEEDLKRLAEELDDIEYNDLKSLANQVGVEFKGQIKSVDLIRAIIDQGKAEEILGMTEVEE